jgi:hypothetical protein
VVLQLQEETGRGGALAAPRVTGEWRVTSTRPVPGHRSVAASREESGIPFCDRPRPLSIPRPQPSGNLALAAARECHQAFRVLGQKRVAEARHRLRPREIRPTHQPAEAAIAGRIARQQDEVRAALRFSDTSQILLDGIAMAGQTGAVRARPGRQTLTAPRVIGGRLDPRQRATAAWRPPRRYRDPRWIERRRDVRQRDERRRDGGRRVGQFYLYPDDRPQPRLLGCGRKSDHSV